MNVDALECNVDDCDDDYQSNDLLRESVGVLLPLLLRLAFHERLEMEFPFGEQQVYQHKRAEHKGQVFRQCMEPSFHEQLVEEQELLRDKAPSFRHEQDMADQLEHDCEKTPDEQLILNLNFKLYVHWNLDVLFYEIGHLLFMINWIR